MISYAVLKYMYLSKIYDVRILYGTNKDLRYITVHVKCDIGSTLQHVHLHIRYLSVETDVF